MAKSAAVGAHAHVERRDPKAASRVLGIARVVAANVPFQVLRAVAGDNNGDAARCAQSIDSRVTGRRLHQ